jgi:hypothetical protein
MRRWCPSDYEVPPIDLQEALLPFLWNEIRYIETLKELDILPGGFFPSKKNMDLEFVEPVDTSFLKAEPLFIVIKQQKIKQQKASVPKTM